MSENAIKQLSLAHEHAKDAEIADLHVVNVGITRTAKVVAGGRVFRFRALVVVGDRNGKVGFGIGRGMEVPVAIAKATQKAKRNMVSIEINDGTLFHKIYARHGASKVVLMPAGKGTGIIASAPARAVFEALGVENVLTKSNGSTNALNTVTAIMKGLQTMTTPEEVQRRRGLSAAELMKRTNINKGEESESAA